jgi:hypothetical protein
VGLSPSNLTQTYNKKEGATHTSLRTWQAHAPTLSELLTDGRLPDVIIPILPDRLSVEVSRFELGRTPEQSAYALVRAGWNFKPLKSCGTVEQISAVKSYMVSSEPLYQAIKGLLSFRLWSACFFP